LAALVHTLATVKSLAGRLDRVRGMSLGIREMRSNLHRLAAGQVPTFPTGHAFWCVQMPAFQLKSPRWQGESKLTTLEIGALQSGGDSRLAVTLNTYRALQYIQGAPKGLQGGRSMD